ncbi:MAG: metalloregulator ArsR/SmtB family transcription factor [Clostridiales bacterium]|nr:metalloregulator ArsR/SmtB family transcription factor [Clostridiales bacterium]
MAETDVNLVEMLSVLAEPTRIKILECISREGELCAKDILPMFAITQPTLSHHLNLLIDNKILTSRKEGRFVFYKVDRKSMEALRKLIDSFTEPPVVGKIKKTQVSSKSAEKKPVLKKSSSVPLPKTVIASPDLEEIKKNKKKKKSDKKKKDKDKKKKK